ncbi:MAG: tRNA (N6-isopentenyl adenosine(37)-C2)-methylthiotransferase MiaB, partial [Defluviitaleaceae bacterium]|nr:tRNA (N6-isopentenyl adenosine(37)-C2)-methylthiotransferase MiaB [Defluviitaleaceae bacterium]
EEDFDATLEVVRQVRFSGAFTFIYSKRSGTPAALRTDLVPREIVTDRFERLTALVYPIMQARNEARIGEAFPMMVEELDEKGGKGRLDDNALVHFTHGAGVLALGGIYPVRITAARSFYVNGAVECP